MKRILVLSIMFLAASAAFCQETAKPNFVVISLDTFRADRLQAYGSKKSPAPNLDAFAKEAAVYVNSMTPSPVTLPAHGTLLTGCFPEKTGLFDNGVGVLSPGVKTMAEVLRESGYDTRAFIAADVLKARFGLSRGFAVYDDQVGSAKRRFGFQITDMAVAYMHGGKKGPFFLWAHYFDTHQPYLTPEDPPESVDGRYDRAVSYVDAQVKRLLDAVPPNTFVFIVSDHGEGLGDHGELTHGLLLYQPTVSVVVMAKGPGLKPSISKGFRSLADIAPTIYGKAGIQVPGLDGYPLDSEEKRSVPLSVLLPLNEYRWKPLFGASDGRYKWIRGDKTRLFDISGDPGETADISAMAPGEARKLKSLMSSYEAIRGRIDLASFSGLGYLTGTPSKDTQIDKMPDPESMLGVFRGIDEVKTLRENDKFADSVVRLRELVKKDPGNPSLLFALGDSLRHVDQLDEAVRWLDESLKFSPALVPAWISKALALLGKERKEEAILSLEKALAHDPDSIEAVNILAAACLDLDRPEKAFPLIENAIARGLADTDTYLMQGRIHLFQKKFDQARNDFKLAMESASDQKETRKAIADKYLLYGYKEIGIKYLTDGIAMYPDYAPNYLTLGAVYLSTENYRAALEVFEKALSLNLPPEDRKNVSDIVSDLRKGLDIKEVK
ncbi:MAG TPA: sulfatase-like hydrolase/transferase [Acidobacteriota bacterium]|nr:sulfatase-like hydrolase/transferase [Acidobacteriota bacterium]